MDSATFIVMNEVQGAPFKRGPGRPRDPTLTDAERRAHRRFKPKQENREPERQVTITLSLSPTRNGQCFGPGKVTVPYGLAQEMLYAEHHAGRAEEKLQDFWQGGVP